MNDQQPHARELAVDVQSVRKQLGHRDVLRDISLAVPHGSIFGFLGPNGAGKTTTLRLLIGMIQRDSGTARVLSLDPWSDRVALHARIGYVPGGAASYPSMRGAELLDYYADLAGVTRESAGRAEVVDALELSTSVLGRRVGEYSKGMRQKLAIAQALQHRPELLLLDEPSDGLDPLVQHALYDVLRSRASSGTTVLFSSHALAEVDAICEYVAIIREGTLVVQSSLEELRALRPRVLRVRLVDEHDAAALDQAFTPMGIDAEGRRVYHVAGAVDDMLARLANIRIDDLVVEEASLDDVFRSYYAGPEDGLA